jgi:spore coat polysaccharide biosynthesis protein SpsF
MGSTRLPGKVLLEAAGKPLLGLLLERLSCSRQLEKIIVATTTDGRDDVIENYCKSMGVPVYRGSEKDVLDRYYQTAKAFGLDRIVRVTSDCPLIDSSLIDEKLENFEERFGDYDLVTNRHPLTYVDGLDFDIIPLEALEFAWRSARETHQREHVVPFFWEAGLRVHNFEDPRCLFYVHRWTLDYVEDFELIRSIYTALYKKDQRFSTNDILEHLAAHPELPKINARYLPTNNRLQAQAT